MTLEEIIKQEGRQPDCSGYVTKYDIECSDGLTIRQGAFNDDDGRKVPMVWMHDHKNMENVLGHVYLESLDDGVYGYGAALAVIAKEVTYVHAPEVEIEKSNLGFKEIDALLKGDISALYPSANGDAYIAEQINSALTVTVLGDANGDGVVDSYDAALIARYVIGLIGANDLNLSVCDFNEDGVVDSYDAALIARYDVGLLAA